MRNFIGPHQKQVIGSVLVVRPSLIVDRDLKHAVILVVILLLTQIFAHEMLATRTDMHSDKQRLEVDSLTAV